MTAGKVLLLATFVAVIFAAGAAPSRPIARTDLEPGQSMRTSGFDEGGVPEKADIPSPLPLAIVRVPDDSAAERRSDEGAPPHMGLFGIGITGLITLRRFRKYF